MCTSFAVYGREKTIYGMNFDSDDIGLIDNKYLDIAGVNSDGLFIYTQALEYSAGFKPSCSKNDVFAFDIFDESIKETKKVSEFSEILNNRIIVFPGNPLFPGFGLHTIIADKYGDAFIIEEGIDENIISKIMNDFIIMTNFPNGAFQGLNYDKVYGCGADRYICAHEYISNNINSFGINEAFEVLKRTSQEITMCSIVFEPLKNEAYISLKTDFEKKWKISITEKTIQSLDGLLSNNKIQFTNGEIFVKDLINLYK
ncbi:MAG: linear amide hydrolase, choloylglycine hydrolase family [Sedimentibacter sp.]|nr:linear amide hydrolase, choloylglycine hydrolase family [Sedimentibacter sp.]